MVVAVESVVLAVESEVVAVESGVVAVESVVVAVESLVVEFEAVEFEVVESLADLEHLKSIQSHCSFWLFFIGKSTSTVQLR